MKKICFFHPSSDLYGSDKILLELLSEYDDFEKTVVLRRQGPLVNRLEERGDVRVEIDPNMPILAKRYLNAKGAFSFVRQMCLFSKSIRKRRLYENDVVYLNTIATIPILLFFGQQYKRIVHMHEIADNSKSIYRLILNFIAKHADCVICVSDAVKRTFSKVSNKYIDKIYRVYNGIPLPKESESGLMEGVDSMLINMALVGRVKPQTKGQNIFVDAISQLSSEDRTKCHFYIVGSTVSGQEYMLSDLEQYIQQLGVSSCITILPFVYNIANVYRSMDVIVVPSTYEDPLPTTVLEAMSFKRAVIGSISGGIPEMINGGGGLLVDKNNSNQLADAIRSLIEYRPRIEELQKRGYDNFVANFTQDQFHKNYQDLLSKILS